MPETIQGKYMKAVYDTEVLLKERDEAYARLALARNDREAAWAAMTEARGELAEAKADLAILRTSLASSEQMFLDVSGEVKELSAQLADANASKFDLGQELDDARAALESQRNIAIQTGGKIRRKLASTRTELETTKADLDAAKADLVNTKALVVSLREKLGLEQDAREAIEEGGRAAYRSLADELYQTVRERDDAQCELDTAMEALEATANERNAAEEELAEVKALFEQSNLDAQYYSAHLKAAEDLLSEWAGPSMSQEDLDDAIAEREELMSPSNPVPARTRALSPPGPPARPRDRALAAGLHQGQRRQHDRSRRAQGAGGRGHREGDPLAPAPPGAAERPRAQGRWDNRGYVLT